MGLEIERKFLVVGDSWRGRGLAQPMRQGYLCVDPDRTVRVRLAGERAWLTVKGRSHGSVRSEFEVELPAEDASTMLDELCLQPILAKTRTRVMHGAHTWEVDEFFGENLGLVLAEIELASEHEAIELPEFVGEEVTGDLRYYNSSLLKSPFSRWKNA